ncbi:MAG: flagellar hook-associated protein FlgK [Pseudomonadota bacterium]
MSLSSALSNATSGLAAASRSAETIANNVANSMTEGYGRREIRLVANSLGGVGNGVSVDGVSRVVNQTAMNERRLAEAAYGSQAPKVAFYQSLESTLGAPDQPNSISSQVSDIEAALVTATANPENTQQLSRVVSSFKSFATTINSASDTLKQIRESADQGISESVKTLNTSLKSIEDLNVQIRAVTVSNGNANGLIDERQRVIDTISEIIPIKEVPSSYGTVRILTPNGTTLVDNEAAQFSFSSSYPITPDMTVASGALSELTLSGAASTAGTVDSIIEGGSLSSQFEVRDKLAVEEQTRLDTLAETLVNQFSTASLDPTLSAAPGLFTDAGGSITPGNELGLAGRLTVNPAIDPAQGGEVWRLRDGIGATTPGPVGNREIISGLNNLMKGNEPDGSQSPNNSVLSISTGIVSAITGERISSESVQAYFSSNSIVFKQIELEAGVDTDQELQELLLVEQSYAANAQILATIDEMLQSLLRI